VLELADDVAEAAGRGSGPRSSPGARRSGRTRAGELGRLLGLEPVFLRDLGALHPLEHEARARSRARPGTSGSRSGRDDSSCPSVTYVVPSSSSVQRKRTAPSRVAGRSPMTPSSRSTQGSRPRLATRMTSSARFVRGIRTFRARSPTHLTRPAPPFSVENGSGRARNSPVPAPTGDRGPRGGGLGVDSARRPESRAARQIREGGDAPARIRPRRTSGRRRIP
jgi:hypothetical protein